VKRRNAELAAGGEAEDIQDSDRLVVEWVSEARRLDLRVTGVRQVCPEMSPDRRQQPTAAASSNL
jgi:hypothetical protein